MALVGLAGFAGVIVFGLLYVVFFFRGASLKLPAIGMAAFALVIAAAVIIPKLELTLPALPALPDLPFPGGRPSPTARVEQESPSPAPGGFPQLLLNKRGLAITATGLVENGAKGSALNVSIENRSETDVTVQISDACVNGWMMDVSFSASAAAGQRTEASILFLASGMKRSGIEAIAELEFSFHILDRNRVTFLDSDPVTVRASAGGTCQSGLDGPGQELYSENGLRIVSGGFAEQESVFGPELVLFMENTADRTLTVQAKDVSVNGAEIKVVFSRDILPGRRAAAAVTVPDIPLDAVREMSFSLRVADRDRRTGLFDAGPFTVRAD